jgi:hypothetical protein
MRTSPAIWPDSRRPHGLSLPRVKQEPSPLPAQKGLAVLAGRRSLSGPLQLGAPTLSLEAAISGSTRRLGRAPPAPRAQPVRDPLLQALQRQLAVPRLAARVLGDRGDPWPVAGTQAALLLVRERPRGVDLEDRLDPRRGHVRVLSSGPGGAAGAQLDFSERNLDQYRY